MSPVFVQQRNTTILCVRKDGKVVMAGDGQASQGSQVAKSTIRKVRRIGDNVVIGFAGSTADAMTLMERLESKLEEHPGQMMRACVELAKQWRTEKYLRHLEATMIVADQHNSFELCGNGDVLESETDVMAIGSGGSFAHCKPYLLSYLLCMHLTVFLGAALALIDMPALSAEEIVRKAMKIAGDRCVYTNHNLTIEIIDIPPALVPTAEGIDTVAAAADVTAPLAN